MYSIKSTNIDNILGPLEGQDPKKEYPYKGRGKRCQIFTSLNLCFSGPEKYFLYEIISNKLTGKLFHISTLLLK